jgi:hypothetical protein
VGACETFGLAVKFKRQTEDSRGLFKIDFVRRKVPLKAPESFRHVLVAFDRYDPSCILFYLSPGNSTDSAIEKADKIVK